MTQLAERLLDCLTTYRLPAKFFVDTMGLNNKSELRDLVHELRLNGYPVCSRTDKGGGYWLGSKEDIERTLADLKSRRNELNDIIAALERGQIDGQMEIKLEA